MPPEVLLVENNLGVAGLVVAALRGIIPDISIQYANRISQALDVLYHTGKFAVRTLEQTPELILLSLDLPNNDSWELFHIIKSYVRTQNIPIILLGQAATIPTPFGKRPPHTNRFVVKCDDHKKFMSTVARAGAYWLESYMPETKENADENGPLSAAGAA